MYIKDDSSLQKKLELFVKNLDEGCTYFNTKVGLSMHYEAMTFEIQALIKSVQEAIETITNNKSMFPEQPLFRTKFINIAEQLGLFLQLSSDDPYVSKSFRSCVTDLRQLLKTADMRLNYPGEKKMRACYDELWEKFINLKWPIMYERFKSKTLSVLSNNAAVRMQQLEHNLDDITEELNENPVVICKKMSMDQNVMDVIAKDGQLIPEEIASTIYNCRKDIHNEETIYDFFRLFMTYQELKSQMDQIQAKHHKNEQQLLEEKFWVLGEKMFPVVNNLTEEEFRQLIHSLCAHPDIAKALKKKTLKSDFNIKLVYNLFGMMQAKGIINTSWSHMKRQLTTSRIDEYFKPKEYEKYASSFSELNAGLQQSAAEIISQWCKKSDKKLIKTDKS